MDKFPGNVNIIFDIIIKIKYPEEFIYVNLCEELKYFHLINCLDEKLRRKDDTSIKRAFLQTKGLFFAF